MHDTTKHARTPHAQPRGITSVKLTGSSLEDLAAICILIRPSRLQRHELNQAMHTNIVLKGMFSRRR
jgi:hypothetical protein